MTRTIKINPGRYPFVFMVVILAAVYACADSDTHSFYIKYDSIRNLKEGSDVYCKNVPIGNVTDLKLLPDYKILVEVKLNKSINPSKSDTFALVTSDFFGPQIVELIPGKSTKDLYKESDTVIGVVVDRSASVNFDSHEQRIIWDSLVAPYIKKDSGSTKR